MIDINSINELEEQALQKRIIEEERRQKQTNSTYDQSRISLLAKVEEGKKKAEQLFPQKLRSLENDIRDAVKYRNREVTFSCEDFDEWTTQYLQVMFVQLLPMEGLVCKINEYNIVVSW